MEKRSIKDFEHIYKDGYEFTMSEYFSSGWKLFEKSVGPMIGYGFIFIVISSMASVVLGLIPIVGSIVNQVASSVLIAGYSIYMGKKYLNRNAEFEDFFRGIRFITPIAFSLLFEFLVGLPIIIVAAVIFFSFFGLSSLNEFTDLQDPLFWKNLPIPDFTNLILPFILLFSILIVYALSYLFVIKLIVNSGLQAWTAMEVSRRVVWKRFFHFLLFTFVLGLINIAGAMLIGIGLLFTLPLTTCIIHVAYEKIIRSTEQTVLSDKYDSFGEDSATDFFEKEE